VGNGVWGYTVRCSGVGVDSTGYDHFDRGSIHAVASHEEIITRPEDIILRPGHLRLLLVDPEDGSRRDVAVLPPPPQGVRRAPPRGILTVA